VRPFLIWTLRLLLPLSAGFLLAFLKVIWDDTPDTGDWMAVAAMFCIVVSLIGIGLWAFSTWVDKDRIGDPDRN
jgi:hypothetical protein